MSFAFNEDQLDILREVMNISLGETTANIAQLLGAFGTMHIPEVDIISSKDLQAFISRDLSPKEDYHVTKQLFSGHFGGEVIFIISKESSLNLAKNMFQAPTTTEDEINDSVMELTNIVTSTIVSRLAAELDVTVQFFAPTSAIMKCVEIVDEEVLSYSTVIVLKTIVDFQDENIVGNIFVLTKDEAIQKLKDLLDKKLEELFA